MDNVNAIVKEHRRKATAIAKALNRYMENPKFRAAIEKHRKSRTVRGNSTPVFGNATPVYVFDVFEESLMRLADEQPELFEAHQTWGTKYGRCIPPHHARMAFKVSSTVRPAKPNKCAKK